MKPKDTGRAVRTPFELPREGAKQILAVLEHPRLIEVLTALAQAENAQLCLLRPKTPDLIAFSGNLLVVDRHCLGSEHWDIFCEFLAEVNRENGPPQDEEECDSMDCLHDAAPIIIVDKQEQSFSPPTHARGPVFFLNQDAPELVKALVRRLLRSTPFAVASSVTGCPPE